MHRSRVDAYWARTRTAQPARLTAFTESRRRPLDASERLRLLVSLPLALTVRFVPPWYPSEPRDSGLNNVRCIVRGERREDGWFGMPCSRIDIFSKLSPTAGSEICRRRLGQRKMTRYSLFVLVRGGGATSSIGQLPRGAHAPVLCMRQQRTTVLPPKRPTSPGVRSVLVCAHRPTVRPRDRAGIQPANDQSRHSTKHRRFTHLIGAACPVQHTRIRGRLRQLGPESCQCIFARPTGVPCRMMRRLRTRLWELESPPRLSLPASLVTALARKSRDANRLVDVGRKTELGCPRSRNKGG